eukprot:GILJ01003692.1.p1 GENE.GILJ01003692.1~~GILJ01003692.1.p1  ORF type:complete len:486 (-),score=52.64 GILJ01003692.1:162-1529(-)
MADTKSLGVGFVFTCLGAGIMFSWNGVLTALGYFKEAYPSHDVGFLFPLVFFVSSLLCQVLMLRFGQGLSLPLRIRVSFISCAVLLVFCPLTNFLRVEVGFAFLCVIMSLLGWFSAVLQSSFFGLCGQLPPHFTTWCMSGQAWSGLIICFCRIATKAALPDTHQGLFISAIIYFSIAAVSVTGCCLLFSVFIRQPEVAVTLDSTPATVSVPASPASQGSEHRKRLSDAICMEVDEGGSAANSFVAFKILDDSTRFNGSHYVHAAVASTVTQQPPRSKSSVQLRELFVMVQKLFVTVLLVFICHVITFSVFPGVMTRYTSSYGLSDEWLQITLIAVYNVFDLIGRWLSGVARRVGSRLYRCNGLICFVVMRVVFVPLFLAAVGSHEDVFSSDLFKFIVMSLFALTHGLFVSWLMMFGPSHVTDAEEKERAGFVLTTALLGGIFTGCQVALGIAYLL